MAAQDITSNTYLYDKGRVADLLNAIVYRGRPVIRADDIREITPIVPRMWWNEDKLEAEVRIADASYRVVTPWWTAIFLFQNQTDISYIMPVRGLDLEAASYYGQWKDIGIQHEKKKDLRQGGEFLSRFTNKDRLEGVMTIVLYYGREKWDGPRTLKEQFADELLKDKLQDFIQDYSLNLVEVRSYPYIDRFQTDLRQVFGFLQRDDDQEKLRQFVRDNQVFFNNVPEDAYDLLAAMSHVELLSKYKESYLDERSKNYMMSKAFEDWSKEEREEGRLEGLAEEREQISVLGSRMKAENRFDDFLRCITDLNYRRDLLLEYGMAAK